MSSTGFQSKIETRGVHNTISLKGSIDEHVSLDSLVQIPGALTFNFKDVTNINSHGIVVWEAFLKKLGNREVYFEECPSNVVRLMNLIPSFRGHAKVKSVYVPYSCNKCNAESLVLVDESRFKGGVIKVPRELPCPTCHNGAMAMDGKPKEYFAFAG